MGKKRVNQSEPERFTKELLKRVVSILNYNVKLWKGQLDLNDLFRQGFTFLKRVCLILVIWNLILTLILLG